MAEPSPDVDLWGDPFADGREAPESAPVALLREQADVLTSRTGGRVEGVVLKDTQQGTSWASLYVKVPSLQGYMHKIIAVNHPVSADPANPFPLMAGDLLSGRDLEKIHGMEEFRDWLKSALSSDGVHAVIVNLLTYSPDRAAS